MGTRFIPPFADVGTGLTVPSGAQFFFFDAGTSDKRATYSDKAETTANANPVIADSDGVFGNIFISGSYKVILKDKNNVQIWEADPVDSGLGLAVASVANITALKALTAQVDNESINVVNHTTDGDLGGGVFWFDSASSATDDNGVTIQPTTGTGRWIRQHSGSVSVRMFGATGDGVTDDYTACQAALDHFVNLTGGFGTVIFPRGIYITSDTLTIVDSGDSPHRIVVKGDGMGVTYVYHTGAQTSGAFKFTGDTTAANTPRNSCSVKIEDMAIGSSGGSCLWLNFTSNCYPSRLGFFSALSTEPYMRISGAHMGFYTQLVDLRGNQAMAEDAKLICDAAATRTDGINGYLMENGAPKAGVYGACLEHWFHQCRLDTGYSQDGCKITKNDVGASNHNWIYFNQCKFTGSSDAVTDYPVLSVDGGVDVHWIGGTLETSVGTHAALRVENQLGNSQVYLTDCHQESSGTVQLGTSGGSDGTGTIELHMTNTQFYQLLDYYSSASVEALTLNNTRWLVQPSAGLTLTAIDQKHIVNSYVVSGGVFTTLDESYQSHGNAGGQFEIYTAAVTSASGSSDSHRKSRGTQAAPTNTSNSDTIHTRAFEAYAGGAYQTVLSEVIAIEDAATNYTARYTVKDNDGTEVYHIITDGGSGTGKIKLNTNLQTKISTANVDGATPSDAELDAAFGTPATVGAGFMSFIDDNGAGTSGYCVFSDGTNWWYQLFSKAV